MHVGDKQTDAHPARAAERDVLKHLYKTLPQSLCSVSVDRLTRRAFTSTPASFSSALINAEAFSFPKPSATAYARFFSATRSAGTGDCRLSQNFSMRSASLRISLSAKLGEKSRFKI